MNREIKFIDEISKDINPEDYNPYQATKFPTIDEIKKKAGQNIHVFYQSEKIFCKIFEFYNFVKDDQMENYMNRNIGEKVYSHLWNQISPQLGEYKSNNINDPIKCQVASQFGAVKDISMCSFYFYNIPFSHWFLDFLNLGVLIITTKGKMRVHGKNGIYLGEYDDKELLS